MSRDHRLPRRVRPSRLRVLVLALAAPLVLWAVLPLGSSGRSLSSKISNAQNRIDSARSHERVLSTDIAGYSRRINSLQGDITGLERRVAVIQAQLDVKQAQLARTQEDLRTERARLARLKARLAADRVVLGRRLREIYTAHKPDIVTVILEAKGFADLLERGEFMERINQQDARIVTRVRTAKEASAAATRRLTVLEVRQRRIAQEIEARRNEVAVIRDRLVGKRESYANARAGRESALRQTRSERRDAQEDLASLEAEQARVQAALSGGGSLAAGPIRHGSGRFIWPVTGPITGTFGENRGDHIHVGLDIQAPEGAPIRAADSGTVRIASDYGGYGNYTCIQHSGSLSTCYAHQSGFAVSVGQSVSQGQVIGYVGNTGNSFGAHLHFEVRVNGSPVDPMGYL
jgi:murein DD-endopeptidase MepM/ murein hydrolase activator NlpD